MESVGCILRSNIKEKINEKEKETHFKNTYHIIVVYECSKMEPCIVKIKICRFLK